MLYVALQGKFYIEVCNKSGSGAIKQGMTQMQQCEFRVPYKYLQWEKTEASKNLTIINILGDKSIYIQQHTSNNYLVLHSLPCTNQNTNKRHQNMS